MNSELPEELRQRLHGMVAGIVTEAIGPIVGRLNSISERLRKQSPNSVDAAVFFGRWRAGYPYRAGSLVTLGRDLWCCISDTDSKPGYSESWQLAAITSRETV